MRKPILVVAAVAAMTLFAVAGYGKDGGVKFSTTLTGAEEFPGPGDPDGIGFASLRLNAGTEQVCFRIFVEDITLPATGAHIHEAVAGDSGPVVVGLTSPDETGLSSGCVSASRELILDIIQNPAEYYVNVHSSDFQAGAVRGQLGD
jgi:hypothetical protein